MYQKVKYITTLFLILLQLFNECNCSYYYKILQFFHKKGFKLKAGILFAIAKNGIHVRYGIKIPYSA